MMILSFAGLLRELLSVWDKSKFQLERVIKFDRFIVIEGVWNWEKLSVSMVNVCAPCEAVAQDLLWDNLLAEKSGSNRVWILAGDFNAIRFRYERKGCVSKVKVSSAFNNFIEKGDLQEAKLVGRRFTWFGPTGKRSLLDRFLVSDSWLQNQSDLVVQALQRSVSDHVPLLLSSLVMDWGPIPFKFFNAWLQVEECTKTITDSLRDPKMVDRDLPENTILHNFFLISCNETDDDTLPPEPILGVRIGVLDGKKRKKNEKRHNDKYFGGGGGEKGTVKKLGMCEEDEETIFNRKLAKDLIDKWSRPIFNKSTRFEDRRNVDDDRVPMRKPPMKRR
ncbi:hypothetical protein GQ457_14G024150 [Hibiscus cannabinus]